MAKPSKYSLDLARLATRRNLLALAGIGVAGAAFAALRRCGTADGFGQGSDTVSAQGPSGASCIALPPETEGPFPADGTGRSGGAISVLGKNGLVRSDIRSSFAGLSGTADGVSLSLEIDLVDVDNGCTPLAGHALYLWHCDANGDYSLYTRREVNYLRGVQVADAAGKVRFRSIFPACYDGRWPHLHFEVFASLDSATNGDSSILTSQFALPTEACSQVYADGARYPGSSAGLSRLSITTDGIFGDNMPEQVTAQTLKLSGSPSGGYAATGSIGLTKRYR